MSVITRDDYKLLAQITGSSLDTLIDRLIVLVEGDFKYICSRTFLDANGAESWPVGCELIATKMISYQLNALTKDYNKGFESESQGGYSYSRGHSVKGALNFGYPSGVIDGIFKYAYHSVIIPQSLTQWREKRLDTVYQLAEDYRRYQLTGIPYTGPGLT